MIIPDKIKIGRNYYTIKKVKHMVWGDTSIVGKINYGDKLMKLKMYKRDNISNQDTFFHEVAHGLLKELEFNYPQMVKFRNDESFTQELGLTLRITFLDLLGRQEAEK